MRTFKIAISMFAKAVFYRNFILPVYHLNLFLSS